MATKEPVWPTATCKDHGATAVLTVLMEELTVEKKAFLGPKVPSKDCEVDIKINESFLSINAKINDKKKGLVEYFYKVNQLPSPVLPLEKDGSSDKYEKGKIVLNLKKKEETSWEVQLSTSGIDQKPDP